MPDCAKVWNGRKIILFKEGNIMAITKLNNVLVKHGKIMFGIITAIIIVAFVWFFTPGADGSILFGSNPNSPDAVCGEVAGQPIKNKDVSEVTKAHTLINAAMANVKPEPGKMNLAFEQAFNYAAMYKAAETLGLVVPEEQVAKALRSLPTFQKDGKFDEAKYKEFEKNMLQPAGYNAEDLENAMKIILSIESMPVLFDDGVYSPSEQMEYIKNDLETTTALSVVFDVNSFKVNIKPTEKDLTGFYNSNKAKFMNPEEYNAEVVMFNYGDYKVKIDEKAAKADYEKNKSNLITLEGKQMTFDEFKRDLLLAEQAKAAMKDAKAFREKVYKATETIAGDKKAYLAEFQKLAAKEAKKNYVKIGWFSSAAATLPVVGAEVELLKRLNAVAKEKAPVTGAVMGEKAAYVAAVTDIKAATQKSYAAAKAEVREAYINQKASAKANESMANLRAALVSAKKANKKIDETQFRELAKGAIIEKLPPIKMAEFKNGVFVLQKQMEELSKKNLSEEQLKVAFMQGQFQLRNYMMNLETFAPVMEASIGTLSKDQVNSMGVMAFFVIDRKPASQDEIEKYKSVLTYYLKKEKQQIVASGLYEWLGKSLKNHVQQAQQEQNKQGKQEGEKTEKK